MRLGVDHLHENKGEPRQNNRKAALSFPKKNNIKITQK